MSPKRKQAESSEFDHIKTLIVDNKISQKEIKDFAIIDYPLFSFRYFRPHTIKKCKDAEFFRNFLGRLQELSTLGWSEIRGSRRHKYGMEQIPVSQIKPDLKAFGDLITDDVEKLHVFRADNDNHPFVGLQIGRIFHIIFLEYEFGDIYDHG